MLRDELEDLLMEGEATAKDSEIARLRSVLERLSIPLAPDTGNENEYKAWGRQELINIINTKADIASRALEPT